MKYALTILVLFSVSVQARELTTEEYRARLKEIRQEQKSNRKHRFLQALGAFGQGVSSGLKSNQTKSLDCTAQRFGNLVNVECR